MLALIGLVLTVSVFAIYRRVFDNGFVFDDRGFVTENPHVVSGLTAQGLLWAFTTTHTGNWHPLTWISHLLDVQLFGLQAAGHHLTSVLLHAANSLLLLLVLRLLTGSVWRSALVAALFAVHPLHVESVAWVAERKDVLSAFFVLLALAAHRWYAARPAAGRYAAVAVLFALALMSKPMAVSLPILLLLLDWWPLARGSSGARTPFSWRRCAGEKLPLLGLAALCALVTIVAQRQTGTLGSLLAFPLSTRVENALVAYATYLLKLFYPSDLACLYPYASDPPGWKVGGAALVLLAVTAAVIRRGREHGALVTGWLWYLVALVPVIGLVQVGVQSMADRYTYLPSIGIFVLVVWGIPECAARFAPAARRLAARALVPHGLALALCLALGARAAAQVGYWKDDVTLFGRAVAVTTDNALAHYNLGTALEKRGKLQEAMAHLDEAARLSPTFTHARNNIGHILSRQGDYAGALREFSAVVSENPRDAMARFNLGWVLAKLGRAGEAKAQLAEALKLDPALAEAHYSLGNVLMRDGLLDQAAEHYRAALRSAPEFALAADAHNNLGIVLAARGEYDEAIASFQRALRLNPDHAGARDNLTRALGRRAEGERGPE